LSIKMSERTNAAAPEGVRLYAIGDIHGRADLLDRMLKLIEEDRAARTARRTILVFLGDYIDRGRDTKAVVSRLIDGLPANITPIFLKGNHEDFLLTFLDQPHLGLDWLRNGGDWALMSYGAGVETIWNAYRSGKGLIEAWAVFRDLLPEKHEAFYRSLKLFYRAGEYFFVHAGVRPGVGLEAQSAEDMLWIRAEFLNHRDDLGAVIVHGHTPAREPQDMENRIGIDTLAFHSGKLTAVGLEGNRRWFLTT
jgi:serine/threonine protein phosphatase 1